MDELKLRRLVAVEVADLSAARTFMLNLSASGLLPDTTEVDALVLQFEGTRKFKNRMVKHMAFFGPAETGASQ